MASWKYLTDQEKRAHELYEKRTALDLFFLYLKIQVFVSVIMIFPRSTVVRWNAKPVDIIPFFTINLHDAVYISPRSSTHTLALNLPC